MKKIVLFVFTLLITAFSYAQEVNSIAGGNASGIGGVVNYSIGQTFANITTGANGTVIEGVQQPYEISVLTAIENTERITLECIVYPNPTSGFLKLSVKTDEFKNLKFEVYNLNGIRILENEIDDEETEISLEQFPSSYYIMKIFSNNIVIKTFKIIKK